MKILRDPEEKGVELWEAYMLLECKDGYKLLVISFEDKKMYICDVERFLAFSDEDEVDEYVYYQPLVVAFGNGMVFKVSESSHVTDINTLKGCKIIAGDQYVEGDP